MEADRFLVLRLDTTWGNSYESTGTKAGVSGVRVRDPQPCPLSWGDGHSLPRWLSVRPGFKPRAHNGVIGVTLKKSLPLSETQSVGFVY